MCMLSHVSCVAVQINMENWLTSIRRIMSTNALDTELNVLPESWEKILPTISNWFKCCYYLMTSLKTQYWHKKILRLRCSKKVKPKGRVALYTSVPTDVINELKAEFEKRQRGVELDIFRSGTGKVMEKIYEEIKAGKIEADVIWVADFTVCEELKNAGQLMKYETSQAPEIIPPLKDKGGYYFGACLLIW